ncbi:MAG: hypothetical protein ACI4PW_02810 [Alphaproteobacteria bacterium]
MRPASRSAVPPLTIRILRGLVLLLTVAGILLTILGIVLFPAVINSIPPPGAVTVP